MSVGSYGWPEKSCKKKKSPYVNTSTDSLAKSKYQGYGSKKYLEIDDINYVNYVSHILERALITFHKTTDAVKYFKERLAKS